MSRSGSRWTLAFERLAVLQCAASIEDGRQLLRHNWESAQRLMERAVTRGIARRATENIRTLGMDEKSFRKGQSFVSILTDIAGNIVLAVVPEASIESGQQLLATLSGERRQEIAAVTNRAPQALKTARAWKSKESAKAFMTSLRRCREGPFL